MYVLLISTRTGEPQTSFSLVETDKNKTIKLHLVIHNSNNTGGPEPHGSSNIHLPFPKEEMFQANDVRESKEPPGSEEEQQIRKRKTLSHEPRHAQPETKGGSYDCGRSFCGR